MSKQTLNTRPFNRPSLRQYLQTRLLLWAGCIFLIFCLLVYQVYEWGLDDSSEYYLYQDAIFAKGLLETGQPLPSNTVFRKFYLGRDTLPPYLSAEIFSHKNSDALNRIDTEQYYFFEDHQAFYYILALPLKHGKPSLFVIHRFSLDDDAPGLSLESLMFVCAILVLLISLGLAVILYQGITTPLTALTAWCQTIPNTLNAKTSNNVQSAALETREPPYTQLHFLEFHYLAKRLHEHQLQLTNLALQEKDFLNTLSHELRTPMAIVRAALDILSKQSLPESISNKLLKIKHANLRMMQLSQTLLYLWKNEQHHLVHETIDSRAFIENIIEEHQYLLTDAHQTIPCVLDEDCSTNLSWQANPIYLHICISNLLRNALQHGDQNSICIQCNQQAIIITNHLKANVPSSHTLQLASGFGLGLQLAKRLAVLQGWQLKLSTADNVFTCQLIFHA